ncbi:28S ribosomal protein S5, mitochondrial-like [Uloborus diversus]|uniref:28S ribosomal protein S5, mitochondrial-like n=1 Tax=Uloborus diversus TaxID=327109 RepID=UPI002409BAC5|nr:28S ribosomal protein S5, mitochondrial-like [Uloborus diversus]
MVIQRLLIKSFSVQYKSLFATNFTTGVKNVSSIINSVRINQQPVTYSVFTCWRNSHSFFSRTTAEQLWKGVTSVSPAGRKRGRGRGSSRKMARDLNRGQVIGFGKKNMVWPGLNAPIVQGREIIRQQELPPDEERQKRLIELRDKQASRRSYKIHPLERGWSGKKLPGRSVGAPEAYGDETFEGFDSRVLVFKPVFHMTKQRGRVRSLFALVVVGNKNGLAGFAIGKSVNGNTAAIAARNKAGKMLRYINRDNTTVLHDFCAEYGPVKIFVKKRPEGFGLVCHRVIKAICEVVGIKDLHAKVDGPRDSYLSITRAFFIGLMLQKSHQQLAEEKGLHLVEMRNEMDNFPIVRASPTKCRTEEEIGPTELLDYTLHCLNNKVEDERKKFQPFYVNYPSYIKEMKDREKLRNFKNVKLHLLAKYGSLKGFLNIREEEKAKQQLKETVEQK